MKTPRGTTARLAHHPEEWRKQQWAIHWNIYAPGTMTRKQKSLWFDTEDEARTQLPRIEAALRGDVTALASDPRPVQLWKKDTVGAIAPNWLAHVKDQCEASTHRTYKYVVDHFLAPKKGHARHPGLGDHVVSDAAFTTKVEMDFLKGLRAAGIGLSMRKRIHTALSAFCTYARNFEGRLTANPCYSVGRSIRVKGEEITKPEPNPFTADEVMLIFDQLQAVEPDFVPYFQFLLDVGCRVGEAAALKWDSVDLDKARATIAASYCSVSRKDKLPKTSIRREVQLTAKVVEQLLKWKVEQREEAFRRGLKQPLYVFTTRRILPRILPNDGSMRRVLARTLEACNITGHTAHDFRDTFATSHLLQSWERLPWVSRQLGHQTPRTTETYYYKYRDTKRTVGFADDIRNYGK